MARLWCTTHTAGSGRALACIGVRWRDVLITGLFHFAAGCISSDSRQAPDRRRLRTPATASALGLD